MKAFITATFAAMVSALVLAQPVAQLPTDAILTERLGMSAANLALVKAGQPVAWPLTPNTNTEIAAGGAIRATGDLRRLVLWFRDIEAFIRASGTENVGAIHSPATPDDFARLNMADADFKALASCKPGKCEVRMPASYLGRFQNEVTWAAPDASAQAQRLAKQMIGDYVRTYQQGGDAALGAHHNQKDPTAVAKEFQDLLRRATRVWDLAFPFASYLESYPKARPDGMEDRFYWTRDKMFRDPVLTLHHLALQELPGGRVIVADKQFYASRQFNAGLMIATGIPTPDGKGFDLIVMLRARLDAAGSMTGRMFKGQIQKEVVDGLKVYLEWIRASSAL